MLSFDDRYLKESEREARRAGNVLEDTALDREFDDVIIQWRAEEEWQLVIAAQKGDTSAFAKLYQNYWSRLWALCYRIIGQREDAEDLAQETVIKAWEKLNTFDTRYKKFGPWFFRIAVHSCIDLQRHKDRKVKHLGEMLSLEEPIQDDDVEETLGGQVPDTEAIDPAEEATIRVAIERSWPKCWSNLTIDERIGLVFIYRWEGTFKDLGWMRGARRIEPGDDKEARNKKRQSAHNTGKYHIGTALRKLEESLRAEGLDLTPSQVQQLVEEQETEGGDIQ